VSVHCGEPAYWWNQGDFEAMIDRHRPPARGEE
jgi:hypothetical protein